MEKMESLRIDGRDYLVEVHRRSSGSSKGIQILIPVFLTSEYGYEITRICVDSIRKFTPQDHEIWLIDNASPFSGKTKLLELPGVNVVFNRTTPLRPLRWRNRRDWRPILTRLLRHGDPKLQMADGSYANAIGLEIGARLIPQSTALTFAMHNDCVALRSNWLEFLISRLDSKVKAVGCVRDKIRVNALHVSGLLFDFQLFRALKLNFFPTLPQIDVGDKITLGFEQAGYKTVHCENTYNSPDLEEKIPESHPLRSLRAARTFDDHDNLIYAHLGRGTPKSSGTYKIPGKAMADDWVDALRDTLIPY